MKSEQRDVRPARITRDIDRLCVAYRPEVCLVIRARHGREGRDALRQVLVAGQQADKSSALTLSRGVYPVCVDAVLPLELVEDRSRESYVVGGDIGRALPCELRNRSVPNRIHAQGQLCEEPTLFPLGYTTM